MDKLIVLIRNVYLNSIDKVINNKWLKRQCGNTKLSSAIVAHNQLESVKIDHGADLGKYCRRRNRLFLIIFNKDKTFLRNELTCFLTWNSKNVNRGDRG